MAGKTKAVRELEASFAKMQAELEQLRAQQAAVPPPVAAAAASTNANGAQDFAPEARGRGKIDLNSDQAVKMMQQDSKKKEGTAGKKNKSMKHLIRQVVRDYLWKAVKFIRSTSMQDTCAQQVLLLLNLDKFQGNSPQAVQNRRAWLATYSPLCTTVLNETRTYVQSRIKVAAEDWMDEHGGEMPDLKLLEKCVDRTIDLENEDEAEIWRYWWTQVLPKATANAFDWNTEKSHYHTIATAAPPTHPNQHYVPPSTEAFALAAFENNKDKWPRMFALAKEHKGWTLTPKLKKDEKVVHEESVSPKF